MKRDGFDDQLTKIFKEETENIYPSWKLKDKILKELEKSETVETTMNYREVPNMKRLSLKKWAVIAACICLLVPAGLFAAGKITTYRSSSSNVSGDRTENWNDFDLMKEKADVGKGQAVESFSNGYKFESMQVVTTDGMDSAGNKVASFKDLDIIYQKKGSSEMWLELSSPHDQGDPREADQQKEVNGVSLQYFQDTYKFVPPDYKLTDQDKKLEERGDYFVSYGSDKIEIKKFSYVSWEHDGVCYSLHTFDTDLSADQMLDMAAEIVQ